MQCYKIFFWRQFAALLHINKCGKDNTIKNVNNTNTVKSLERNRKKLE